MLFVFNGFCRLGHVLFNSIHNSNPRRGSVLKQIGPEFQCCNDVHDDKHECSRLGQCSYSYESSLSLELSDRHEPSYVLASMYHSTWSFCIKCDEILSSFDSFSNQRRNIVWTTSGCQIVVRIVARILATSFTVAVHWSEFLQQKGDYESPSTPKDHVPQVLRSHGVFGYLPAHICYCSVDTELICRNNRA